MPTYQSDNESESEKPEDSRRGKVNYWLRWIKRARKASECHWQDADQAWSEYENAKSDTASSDPAKATRCYPAYYVNCKFFESALYAKDPRGKGKRRFDIDDDMALTQQLIVERLSEYILENTHFGEAMRGSRDNLIHADKAANQWIFDYKLTEPETDEEGNLLDPNAQPTITNPKLTVKAIQYDEVLHTPDAKSQSEIKEWAFFFCIDEDEAKERYSDIKNLPFRSNKSSRRDDEYHSEDKDAVSSERYLCGWEIYCLETNMVYWVCEEYPNDFLDAKPIDQVSQFRNKVPCTPFVINSKPRKSLFPTPVYKQLEPTINQLHKQYKNLMEMVEAARPRFIVNTDNDDVIHALEKLGSLSFIKAKNFHDILDKAGLQNLIQQVPVDGIVSAMSQLISLEETFRTNMAEWFGTPDIVKGVSETEKTKAEVEIEHGAAYDRFRYIKKQVEMLARDTLEMGIDLILDVFPDDLIARICGWQYMERGDPGQPAMPPDEQNPQGVPEVPPTPGHYERFPIALQQLRNDEERLIRIDIETDSTSFTNEMREMARRQQIFQTVLEGLSTIGGMQNQQFMAPVTRAFMGVLEAIGGAVMEEDSIKQALKELEEAKNQPPPPPPPDFTELKIQAQMQANQIKAQKDMMDAQATNRDLDRKEYETSLKEREIVFNEQMEAVKLQLEQALVELEANRVAIEEFKAKTQADEGKLEEMRLAIDQMALTEGGKDLDLEAEKPAPQAPAPSIVLVDANKPNGARTATIIRDKKDRPLKILFEPVADE